jgi:hypothetical protein
MYNITISFESIDQLTEFIKLIQDQKPAKKEKNPDEKRGKSTKQFHLRAKEYHSEHPDISYKECLKVLSKENKNIDNNIINVDVP